jgi:tetratricopeptide (TPR) repeat protein
MADPTTPSSGGVFISYRRQETAPYARSLREELTKRLGAHQVFMDVDSIAVGVDFVEAIDQAVDACQVLLALVGPQWLTITDAEGQRRLDNPEDTVRLEIQAALARDVRVIPVLVDNTPMPSRQQLPDSLESLARRNALELSYNRYAYDLGRLLEAVEKVVGHTAASTPPPPSAAPAASWMRTEPVTDIETHAISSLPMGVGEPENVVQLIERANVSLVYARFDEAISDLDRALELNPRDTKALTTRGYTFGMLSRHEEAISDLDRALELNPRDTEALRVRGEIYGKMERYEVAIRDLTRALELDPNDTQAFKDRGGVYDSMERYEEAIRDYTRAQRLNPSDSFSFLRRGQSYQALKRYEEAIADLTRALELSPHDSYVLSERGMTFRLMGRYREAGRDLTRAIRLGGLGASTAHHQLRQLPRRFRLGL